MGFNEIMLLISSTYIVFGVKVAINFTNKTLLENRTRKMHNLYAISCMPKEQHQSTKEHFTDLGKLKLQMVVWF